MGVAVGCVGAKFVDNFYELSRVFPKTCHQMTFEDPKDKAFWSVTVYNKTGRMFNDLANVSSNTATVNKDGTYTVSFGCGDNAINNISVTEGNETDAFTLAFRHYVPSQQVRDGLRLLPLIKEVK